MNPKVYIKYNFVDSGSGLTFTWVSKNPIGEESQHDLMRTLIKRLFIEEKILGSREVIDLARRVTKWGELQLPNLFGRGIDCAMVSSERIDGKDHMVSVQLKHSRMFAHSVRQHLLAIPYETDIFDPDVDKKSAVRVSQVHNTTQVLSATYLRAKPEDLKNDMAHPVKTGFIQCRYTGRCWGFRTGRLGAFNTVFEQRTGRSRDQFEIWVVKPSVLESEAQGRTQFYYEGTTALLRNLKLFESEERSILDRYYRIPTNQPE